MSGMRKGSSWLTLWIIITMITPPQAFAGPFSLFNKTHPEETSPLIQMAQAIDELEHEIDGFGSVVVKQPDIWGEARWTKYRQDYEGVLNKELDRFRFTLAAQVSEADSAFLLSATALAGGAGGETASGANVQQVFSSSSFPQPEFISAPGTTANPFAKVVDDEGKVVDGITIEPTVYLDQLSRYVKHLNELRRINEGDDTNDFPGYALNLVRLPVSVLPGDETREGYGAEITFTIEPEMSEALLESTFKDLVVNDILDQLSIPVLKLMGEKYENDKEREKALEAEEKLVLEITEQLESALSRYREFFSNEQRKVDTLREAATALSKAISLSEVYFKEAEDLDDEIKKAYRDALRSRLDCRLIRNKDDVNELLQWGDFIATISILYATYLETETLTDELKVSLLKKVQDLSKRNQERLSQIIESGRKPVASQNGKNSYGIANFETLKQQDKLDSLGQIWSEFTGTRDQQYRSLFAYAQTLSKRTEDLEKTITSVKQQIEPTALDVRALKSVQASNVSSSASNIAQLPVPPSQVGCVFGVEELVDVAESIRKTLSRDDEDDKLHQHHVFDVRAVMAEELDAAYRFLMTMHSRGFDAWSMYCSDQELAAAIQMLDVDAANVLMPGVNAFEIDQDIAIPAFPNCPTPNRSEPGVIDPCKCKECNVRVAQLRKYFKEQVCYGDRGCVDSNGKERAECRAKCIKALAWAILVDSAILNEKLNEDMKRIEADKSVQFLPGYDLTFYGPEPTPEACAVFNEYVRHRWPMHVFAIDPERQEQNVQDAFARRRETQLALALAFTNGTINGEQFNRFARRIDTEIETIALNRTVVGFSHGNETFGWRFYPRVQTPPTQGNIKAFFETAFGPHKNRDLKHRQLEPGPRELLAVIIMPSFIRYARMSSRSSWFKLTHPDRSVFDTEDSVRLGQKMNYVRRCKAMCLEQDCFGRPGDARRLLTAVDQLETRLPLQDTLIQVPHENTIGGYRLFSEGVKALGPELIDYYGEPGINTTKATELFLVGRRFNVNTTYVIAGGQKCEVELLSREVMKVIVPKEVNTVEDGGKVDVHLATAYGVSSSHLRIPVVKAAKKASGPKFSPDGTFGHVSYGNCRAAGFTFLDHRKSFDITGGPKSKKEKVELSVSAVTSSGEETSLTSTSTEIDVTFDKDGKVQIGSSKFATAINGFVAGDSPLFEFQNAVALKVSAKIGDTSFDNTLLIKLGCSAAANTVPVSACATMLPVVDMPVMQNPPRCCKCLNKKPRDN